MTMPFRFAPGCCDPCGPVCGKTYTPEQFTVVSGTYDTATHMLSPGGVIAVPYTGTNVYSLVAIKVENQAESLSDVTYLYGNNPVEISIPANSTTATITHGSNVCTATVSTSSTSARSFKAGPQNTISIFDYRVFITPEGKLLLYDWKGFLNQTRNTITLASLFVDSLPLIRNDNTTSVQVDKIVLYENLPELEDVACNLTRRCSGYYIAGLDNIQPFDGSSQFDHISGVNLRLSGSGCILNELSGDYTLSRENCLSDCLYKSSISCNLTLQAPTFNNRYVVNLARFSYPNEIVWYPFTIVLQGTVSLLPLDETQCLLDVSFDSGDYVFPHGTNFNSSVVSGWRYSCCPAAMGVWKSTPDGGSRPLYCWVTQNADLITSFSDMSETWKMRVFAKGSAFLPYSAVDFTNGSSTSIDIPLSLQSTTYNKVFPLAYQGTALPNSSGIIEYNGSHISDWPGMNPCVEGYRTCPYCVDFYNQSYSIDTYFQNKSISALITGMTHVL